MDTLPIALTLAFADKVLTYLDKQKVDREPTDEEIQIAGDARRLQAQLAQNEADDIQGGDGG